MPYTESTAVLEARIAQLERENLRLRRELEFLRTHTSIAQGIRGETLLAQSIGGTITSYAAGYDVDTPDGRRVEVKFSKLNQPVKSAPTKRWNWCKPLGSMDRGKAYEYLLLIGEKDPRYTDIEMDRSPYVYSLVPMSSVADLMDKGRTVGGMIQVTTNLEKLRKKTPAPEILRFQRSAEEVLAVLGNATIS